MMSNNWRDGKGRSILNFLVNYAKGTMFIKYIDAFAHVNNYYVSCWMGSIKR